MDKATLSKILKNHEEWLDSSGKSGEPADFCGADLRGVDLRVACLREAIFSDADLREAVLSDADLRSASLRDADLRGADLRNADLSGADLCDADLQGADLQGADLRGADLYGVNLSQKIVQIGPIGSRNDYTVYRVEEDIVQCGCWREYVGGSLADFIKHVNETYPEGNEDGAKYRREYLAAIAMFQALREDYLREQGRVAEGCEKHG